jgi:large subunit ribosomal protein L25
MDTKSLKAETRKIVGRKVKKLREVGLLPANVFGKKVKSLAVQVDEQEFLKVYSEAGETGIVELAIGKEKRPVLIYNLQLDPVTDKPLHADFYQVNLKEKVTATVPVETAGESPAEKQGLGTAVQYLDEVEVEALPTDLPEKFEIDLTSLVEVDQAIFVKDIKVDKDKIKIEADPEEVVVKVEALREEEEIVPPVVEEEVVEGEEAALAEGEEKGEEGKKEEPKEQKEEKKE